MPVKFCSTINTTVAANRMTSGLPPLSRSLKLALMPMVVKKYTSSTSRAPRLNSTPTPVTA